MVRVRGMPRCVEMHYRTRTRITRFGKPAGFPVPVPIPMRKVPLGHEVVDTTMSELYAIRMIMYWGHLAVRSRLLMERSRII